MAPARESPRRRFLQSAALALAGSSLPRALAGASPDLKLKKPIKVGCQTILSGPLGGYGEFMKKGALLAMEEINAAGGIGGSPVGPYFPRAGAQGDVGVKKTPHFLHHRGGAPPHAHDTPPRA